MFKGLFANNNEISKKVTVWDYYLISKSNLKIEQWSNIEELIKNSFKDGLWDAVFKYCDKYRSDVKTESKDIIFYISIAMINRYFPGQFSLDLERN